ncbi:MAG: Zn-ribbon domain-containing OB-fold protein [Deltaproteobacteria bacterium]|nr:Zn-ribbon domain-containing OB-fold protein [Deltaproteobacteria bacterium]
MEGIPFKEGLFTWPLSPGEQAFLLGNQCKACRKIYFPKAALCPECLKEDALEDIKLRPRGKLYTYTVVRVPSPGFKVPYAFGYIDLPEGVRICCQISAAEPEKLKLGMDMELIIGQVREEAGKPILGYLFRPVKG